MAFIRCCLCHAVVRAVTLAQYGLVCAKKRQRSAITHARTHARTRATCPLPAPLWSATHGLTDSFLRQTYRTGPGINAQRPRPRPSPRSHQP